MSEESTRNIIINRLEKLAEQITNFEAKVEQRFSQVEERLTAVEKRLDALESKQYETRPIWQAALAGIERLDTKLDLMNKRLLNVEADCVTLGNRVETLEGQRP